MPTPRTIGAAGWRSLWLGVAGVGLVGTAGLLATTVYAPVHPQELLRILVFSPTWIVAGAVALSLRPANRTGLLMMAVGAAQLPPYLYLDEPITYTATRIVNGLGIALAVQLVLAFPLGRLTSRATRLVVTAAYVDVLLSGVGSTLVTESCEGCPRNLLLIHNSEVLRRGVGLATLPLDVIVFGSIIVILVWRWRSSGRPTRRALAPVLWASVATVVFEVALTLAANLLAGTSLSTVLGWSEALVACSFPVAFLIGLLRARLDRGAIADLLVALGADPSPEQARAALASSLGDPSLQLAFWVPEGERFVDAGGASVEVPSGVAGRACTVLSSDHDEAPVAAITYDTALLDNPTLVQAAMTAARLSLANARLQAELRSRAAEVRDIREQLRHAGEAERSRIERDLHDGAQQRLLGIRVALRVARGRVSQHSDLTDFMTATDAEIVAAIAELRDLARGVPRQRLTGDGLRDALLSVAARASLPVEVRVEVGGVPEPIATTAYFVVCEALVNVERHARASAARVEVTRYDDRVVIEVSDDGIGCDRSGRHGNGLRNMRSRVEALAGVFELESAPGGGTRVRAVIPCG
jgi:signal transduction histidine kinase